MKNCIKFQLMALLYFVFDVLAIPTPTKLFQFSSNSSIYYLQIGSEHLLKSSNAACKQAWNGKLADIETFAEFIFLNKELRSINPDSPIKINSYGSSKEECIAVVPSKGMVVRGSECMAASAFLCEVELGKTDL